jgi:hypothetical protein
MISLIVTVRLRRHSNYHTNQTGSIYEPIIIRLFKPKKVYCNHLSKIADKKMHANVNDCQFFLYSNKTKQGTNKSNGEFDLRAKQLYHIFKNI